MLGGFSPELAEAERRWKSFMYTTLYHHPRQRDASEAAQKIVNDLFIAYHADPKLMTHGWAEHCVISEPQTSRHIADSSEARRVGKGRVGTWRYRWSRNQ